MLDRGMDDAKFLYRMKRDGHTVVVRIKDMRRDVFGDGRTIDATLADLRFAKVRLNTYRGVIRAEMRCAVGVVRYYADAMSKDAVTQEFRLEDARVRRFRRLENIFGLCVLAYVFMIRFLRNSRRFKKIVKVLGDNVETLAFKTHSLLCGIRELYREGKVRFISGRPRKRFLPDAARSDLRLEKVNAGFQCVRK